MKKKYMIQLIGCDDSNHIVTELDDHEYNAVRRIAEALTANSRTECEPTMGVFEVLDD